MGKKKAQHPPPLPLPPHPKQQATMQQTAPPPENGESSTQVDQSRQKEDDPPPPPPKPELSPQAPKPGPEVYAMPSHQTSPKSPKSAASTVISPSTTAPTFQITLPPEVAQANEKLLAAKAALVSLASTFDSLGAQATQRSLLGGDLDIKQQLDSLRKQMKEQDEKQEQGIAEIEDLLKEYAEVQIISDLQAEVEANIEAQIDALVNEHVSRALSTRLPQTLQSELEQRKHELADIQCALHNSESRRANAELRSSDTERALHTIYTPDREISTFFPKDLRSLFALDGKASKQLLIDYAQQLDDADSREKNLNRFMQFCGVPYQVVPTSQLELGVDNVYKYQSPVAVRHEYGRFPGFG